MKDHIRELVAQSLLDLRRHGRLSPDLATPDFVIERTKSREHGDYASNIALLLAKPAGMKPRELAELLVNTLPSSQHVEKVSIAGPGFINFTLARSCRLGTVRRVFELRHQGQGAHRHIGVQRGEGGLIFGRFQRCGVAHGQAEGGGAGLHRGGAQFLAAPGGAGGLGIDGDDAVLCGQGAPTLWPPRSGRAACAG